jgi:hypothetical protein
VAQEVACPPSKHEALSSNPVPPTHTKKRGRVLGALVHAYNPRY